MDQRDDDDPMLEINERIKALLVEAMKAHKGADPHDLLAEIVGKFVPRRARHSLGLRA